MAIPAMLTLFFLQACSLNMVSDYDQKSLDLAEALATEIDYFFAKLSYIPEKGRIYSESAKSYLDIEVELNALKFRQSSRTNNELTLKQVDIVIKLWKQERVRHEEKNSLNNFLIKRHRRQFNQMFLAIIRGEESKPKKQQ